MFGSIISSGLYLWGLYKEKVGTEWSLVYQQLGGKKRLSEITIR